MNARERAVEALVGTLGDRVQCDALVGAIERFGLRIVDGAELAALLAARDTLATLDETVRTLGSRVWRTPDDELVVWAPDGPALEGFLPDGSVELVPMADLDAKSRGPAYQRGRADGRLEERAGTEPVDVVTQRVETALAAWIGDRAKLRRVAGDLLDLAQRTLLGEVDGHPFPPVWSAGTLGLTGNGEKDDDAASWSPGAVGDGADPATAGEQAPEPSGGGLVGPPASEGDPDVPTPLPGDRIDGDGLVWRQEPAGCWHMPTVTEEQGECRSFCGTTVEHLEPMHGRLRLFGGGSSS